MTDQQRPVRTGVLIAITAAAGAITFGAALAGWAWADSPRLDLAQWIPAVTGVATLMAAVVAAAYAAGVYRVEVARDVERQQERREAQAASISAWATLAFGGRVTNAGDPTETHQPVDVTDLDLTVRNSSESPVSEFDLHLFLVAGDGDDDRSKTPVATVSIGRILPGTATLGNVCTPLIQRDLREAAARELGAPTSPYRVAIGWQFRDNVGVVWRRDPRSRLAEVR